MPLAAVRMERGVQVEHVVGIKKTSASAAAPGQHGGMKGALVEPLRVDSR